MFTGIHKSAIAGPIRLNKLGLSGDEHVNNPPLGGEGRV